MDNNNNPQNPNQKPTGPNPMDPKIRAVRTLEEDIRDAMQSKNMSQIKMAIAESDAHSGSKTISNIPREAGNFSAPIPKPIQKETEKTFIQPPPVIKGDFIPMDGPANNLENSSVENFQSEFNQVGNIEQTSKQTPKPVQRPIIERATPLNPNVYEKSKTIQTDTFNTSKIGVGRLIQNKMDGTPERPTPGENAEIIQAQINMVDQSMIQSEVRPFPWKKVALSLLIILFLAGGGYGGYYLYSIQPKDSPSPSKPTENVLTILPADENKKVVLIADEKISASKLGALISLPLNAETVRNIYFRKDNILRNGGSDITIQEFLSLVDITVPEQLSSSLKGDFMMGAYGDGGKNYPFLIIKVGFFQGALASMLRFEKDMRLEFTPLFVDDSGILTSTTTDPRYSLKTFTDELISNKDVRILRKGPSDIDTVLLYSFIDQDNLIITTSEKSLKFLVNLYGKRKIVR